MINRRASAWRWIWYGPLLAFVLIGVEYHVIRYAWAVARLAWTRWDFWGGLTSPSADFCWSMVIASILLPPYLLNLATMLMFDPEVDFGVAPTHHRKLAIMAVAGALLLPLLTDFLIWGSFPFTFDSRGVGRLRLIPFLPWPDGPYGTL